MVLSVRWKLAGSTLAMLVALVAATGLVADRAFSQPTTLKYCATIVVPLAAMALIAVRQRTLFLTASAIVIAPFSLQVSAAGVSLSPLQVVLALGAVFAFYSRPIVHRTKFSALGHATVVAGLLVLLPLVNSHSPVTYVTLLLTGATMAWLVKQSADSNEGRRTIVWAFIAAMSLQALLAIYESLSGHTLNLYGNGPTGFGSDYFFNYGNSFRPSAAMPDPISLGNILALACPVALVGILTARKASERFALVALGGVLVIALGLTLSRMSWVGAAAGILVTLLAMPLHKAVRTAAALLIVGSILLTISLSLGGQDLRDRFHSIANPTSSTVATREEDRVRVQLWHASAAVGARHPVAGVGLGNIAENLYGKIPGVNSATHAHNTFINLWAEGGLLGCGAIAFLLVGALSSWAAGMARDRALYAGLGGALIALFVTWSTDYTIQNVPVMAVAAVLFGLLASSTSYAKPGHDRS